MGITRKAILKLIAAKQKCCFHSGRTESSMAGLLFVGAEKRNKFGLEFIASTTFKFYHCLSFSGKVAYLIRHIIVSLLSKLTSAGPFCVCKAFQSSDFSYHIFRIFQNKYFIVHPTFFKCL